MRLLVWLALPTAAFAAPQTDIGWLTFTRDDARLVSSPDLGSSDTEEKDYAWGDLDQDGWTDLVVVRKEPFTTAGRRVNVLFMNEGGTLTDRTSVYAAASDVPGDQGFLTPTNDRDVVVVDVNGDGWLDVVTATTISPGQPKHISHPRIYINLKVDGGGNWLGLLFESARTPDLGTFPTFCGVGAGDVTGDDRPDLFFSHYDTGAQIDINDRLWINDGNGFFTDETSARLTSQMTTSFFGTSAVIADLNGDGFNDILDGESGVVNMIYNNPANEGFFNILHNPYGGAPYHANVGDLNQDGKLDVLISDDGPDRYLLNEGNDALGRVLWSPPHVYNVDDGFASNNLVADLDNDGWPEAIFCDVDVDIPGCGRRMHLFHNLGGTVGGFVSLIEEAGGQDRGALGLKQNLLTGTHDVATLDIDNDGDLDLVIGRCTGTLVFMNELQDGSLFDSYCGPAVPNSSGASAQMSVTGSKTVATNDLTLNAFQLPASQFGYFLASQTQAFIQGPGGSDGNLCLGGQVLRYANQVLNSGALGAFSLTIDLNQLPPPGGAVQAGETWNFQTWFRDNNPGPTSNFTDGVTVLFQ
jgi:VCBS repeat protein